MKYLLAVKHRGLVRIYEYGYLGDWRFMKNKRFYGTILNSVNVQPPMTVE